MTAPPMGEKGYVENDASISECQSENDTADREAHARALAAMRPRGAQDVADAWERLGLAPPDPVTFRPCNPFARALPLDGARSPVTIGSRRSEAERVLAELIAAGEEPT
jgi:hypothetical protein